MTILVTGGAGFIGANFLHDWFATHDEPVVTLDALTYAGNLANLAALANQRHDFVRGSIADAGLVKSILDEHRPRAIVNFAAESHVDRSILGPEAFFETNVIGTLRLLEASRVFRDSLNSKDREAFRFLHVSTDEVYGTLEPDDAPFSEVHPYRPNSPYAASKASSDHIVRAYSETHGLPVLTTNCSNNYGPFQFPEKLIPLVIHNALSGKPLPIYGDGKQVRDWLHVLDHCRAINLVLAEGRPGETYNIGGGNERTNIEVVTAICTYLDERQPRPDGASYATQITYVTDRKGHDRRYAIDATKLRAALGWTAAYTFESGLRQTIDWYLSHQDWVTNVTSGAYRDWIAKQYA
jgi:dTDP-glucose 4,6-dehydratase